MSELGVNGPRSASRASNISSTSSTGLSRKARTRARSKTLIAGESPTIVPATFSVPPERPPRSPRRLASTPDPVTSIFDTASEGEHGDDVIILDDARSFRRPPKEILTEPTRDSVSTNHSFSSSIYPFTASTVSGTEDSLPSPRSILQLRDNEVLSVDPQSPEGDGIYDEEEASYGGEDASYRLRLLQSNQFYLPPAHSKPTQFPQNPAVRAAPPTFLDLFRVGKSRSKPTTPIGDPPAIDALPILRTTSDSTTAGHAERGNVPLPSPRPVPDRSCRVVVVREQIEDVAVAAQQAEQDMHVREARREREGGSQRVKEDAFMDVDPTDAVDLPPVKDMFFAPEATNVGDMAPLPSSSSLDPVEDAWRKTILQAAVNLSMHSSTPSSSSMSMPPTSPGPRPRSSSSTRARSPSVKKMLGKRIVARPLADEPPVPPLPPVPPNRSTRPPALRTTEPQARTSYLPSRANTPMVPATPLGPPPRNYIKDLVDSVSLRSNRSSASRPRSQSVHSIRRAMSSPMLSGAFIAGERQQLTMTPPPLPRRSPAPSSSGLGRPSVDSQRPSESIVSESVYSTDDEEDEPLARGSRALSLPLDGRPSISVSLSESAQPSPTASAFREWTGGRLSSSSTVSADQVMSSGSGNGLSSNSAQSRASTVSPPPRVSSSMAHIALGPPPHHSSRFQNMGPIITVQEPGSSPSTTQRRYPLSPLIIPRGPISLAIHSAPAPASPTAFFDSYQSQPNAMDDLESSDDEDEEQMVYEAAQSRQTLHPDDRSSASSSPRPSFTSLMNPSSTSLGNSIGHESMQPVGYEQPRAGFFADNKKSNMGIHPQHTLEPHQPSEAEVRRPSTSSSAEGSSRWQTSPQDVEEARKLDGLMRHHMAVEKDHLKRIASRQ